MFSSLMKHTSWPLRCESKKKHSYGSHHCCSHFADTDSALWTSLLQKPMVLPERTCNSVLTRLLLPIVAYLSAGASFSAAIDPRWRTCCAFRIQVYQAVSLPKTRWSLRILATQSCCSSSVWTALLCVPWPACLSSCMLLNGWRR